MGIKWDSVKRGVGRLLGRLSRGQPETIVSDVWITDVTQIAPGDVIKIRTHKGDSDVVIASNSDGFITTTLDDIYSHQYLQWRVDEGLISLARLYRGMNALDEYSKY